MTNVLNTLLEITLFSAVLFGAILLFQRLFRCRISAAMGYAVWALLILRLIVPVTIDTGFHVFTAPQQQTVQTAHVNETPAASNVETASIPAPMTNFSDETPADLPTSHMITPAIQTTQTPVSPKPIHWPMALVLLWAAGAFGFLTYTTAQWMRLNRKIKCGALPDFLKETVDTSKKELGIHTNIKVSIQDWLISPALSASLKPTLLLPTRMLQSGDTQALHFSIRHELTHFKRRDHIVSLLLMALRCVYWFNPVVWLAFRRIQTDMETACDAAVTARMAGDERTRYIHMMIDMGSDAKPIYALGMGAGQGRKALEKRVRGMFMTKRTKPTARLAAGLLSALLFIACFTTACQPTPEEPVVIGKGDGLGDLIQATPSASSDVSPSESIQDNDALYTKLGAPKHWKFETTALAGKLNITADVDIELPNVSQLPAATASLSEFTQEDLDRIAEVLGVGDATWTEINHEQTKEEIAQGILDYQARRAEYEAEGDDELVKHMDENIEAYEKMYIDAPDEIKLENIEFKITEMDYYDDFTGVGFEGTTHVNNQPFFFSACNAYYYDGVNRVRANFGSNPVGFGGVDIDAPYNVSLAKEQAAAQASEIAKQLTDELMLCYITPAAAYVNPTATNDETIRNWGWACVFMREINGCPTAYETAERGFRLEVETVPVNYEKMIIVMDDAGMVSFTWDIPMTIKSIDNPDVSLLSFDKLSQRAVDQIAQRLADSVIENIDRDGIDWGDPGCIANIIKAKLGLERIDKPDSTDYYYIPVWKFFVDIIHTDEYYERTGIKESLDERDMPPGFTKLADNVYIDEYGNPTNSSYEYDCAVGINVVTVNAIDGSAIDPYVGY